MRGTRDEGEGTSGGTRRAARIAAGVAAGLALVVTGCEGRREADTIVQQGAPARYGIAATAPAALIARWDVDVSPNGAGLPPGRGTVQQGAAIFAQKCAVCHGAKGQGQAIYPQLIGREPQQGFPFGLDPKLPKTIGNYWPYATTVFDYVRRAMPFTAPGSLSADDAYAVTAFLLAANGVVPSTAVMDAQTLPKVQMPARDRFVPDDRRGGAEVR